MTRGGRAGDVDVDDTPTLGATWLFDNGDDVTIALVLGRVEELLWELADQLEPENGMLWKDLIAACIRMSPSLRSG